MYNSLAVCGSGGLLRCTRCRRSALRCNGRRLRSSKSPRWSHFHRQLERALLIHPHRSDIDHLPFDFMAALIADRNDYGVLGCRFRRLCDRSFDTKSGTPLRRATLHLRSESQVMTTSRTDIGTVQDDGLAVRTHTGLTRRHYEPVSTRLGRLTHRECFIRAQLTVLSS